MMRRQERKGRSYVWVLALFVYASCISFGCSVEQVLGGQKPNSDGFDNTDSGVNMDMGGTAGDAGPLVMPEECAADCESAAGNGCDVDDFAGECVALCGQSPTASQLACLADTPCRILTSALASGSSFCGIPAYDAGSGGYDGGDGGGDADSDCPSQCYLAVVYCDPDLDGMDASVAMDDCQSLCANSPTVSQVNCLSSVGCSVLNGAIDAGGGICGIPAN
jgi:hypothetical protein